MAGYVPPHLRTNEQNSGNEYDDEKNVVNTKHGDRDGGGDVYQYDEKKRSAIKWQPSKRVQELTKE